MTTPAEKYFESNNDRLCYFEWGDPTGQPILLLHATGFHARCWDRVIAHLPPHHRIIAVDLLGHGRSGKPDSLADWTQTAAPIGALIEALDLGNIIGVGHSMGGHCIVQLAAALGERFERLVLIDPVIMAPSYYEKAPDPATIDPSDHPIARRRLHWDSPQQMFDRLKEHRSYAIWDERVLRDYCEFGLLPNAAQGGFDLACPGYLEASVYMGSTGTDPWPFVDAISHRVTLLRAPRGARLGSLDFTRSPTTPELAGRLANATEIYLDDLTHFMPMQDSARIAHYIMDTG